MKEKTEISYVFTWWSITGYVKSIYTKGLQALSCIKQVKNL